MHLSFDNLGEFEEFARFCGFERTDLYKAGVIGADTSAATTVDVSVGVHGDELIVTRVANPVNVVDKLPATPAKRTRRTKAEMEADRQRAEAAMTAPLDDDGPGAEAKEELTEEAAALAALTAAADATGDADGEAYVDTATYVGLHAARLASEVSAKDFLTRCQAFIQKHSLISYGEIMTASGVEPRAVASCDAAKRGEILARMEWQEKDFAPAKA